MSYIPNIRERKTTLYNKTEENAYFQGYLNDKDTQFICGYDFAIHSVLSAIDNFEDETVDLNVILDYLESGRLPDDVINGETRIALNLIKHILTSVECSRNEIGVSFIESMPDEEYDELKKLVDEHKRHTELTDD